MYAVWVVVGVIAVGFVYALCKAASDADAHIRRMEDDR